VNLDTWFAQMGAAGLRIRGRGVRAATIRPTMASSQIQRVEGE
jgi:hypothetical protein